MTIAWRNSLAALVFALTLILVGFWGTLAGMVDIWERSGTFTHAFLVPPISLWLIWRLRGALAAFTPAPAPWLALPLLLLGLLWLLGALVAVNVVTQFAVIGMIVLCVPLLLGLPLARAIAFPLLFLFFCVPFGEFIMPRLMQWTADITVLFVRLSGVPVYQEGLQFIIPSGRWSVVEACSGIRYLIASICVGVLFAYLNYTSWRRRLLFVIAAALVPLLANWLRAYGIVMLGHLSGNKLATGVDHLVYGWVFFGIVMTLLFMLGMRWQEPERLPAFTPTRPVRSGGLALAVALLSAALLIPRAGLWLVERGDAHAAPELQIAGLSDIGAWTGAAAGFSSWRPAFSNPAATWQRSYASGTDQAAIYLAYYRNQGEQRKLVSSENRLARSDDDFWAVVERGSMEVDGVAVRTASLRGGSVSSGGEQRLRTWQWYWVDGTLTASDIKAKLLTLKSRLAGRGDDGAIIVLYAPELRPGEGDAILGRFAPAVGAALLPALAHTREQ
ncbi:MAG TPA: exosortase A [Rhodocyclaceae bacterium]|nr:exosortase A [Rhodocyclaceae bacterium]